jgi:S-adenosyl methyltransferase
VADQFKPRVPERFDLTRLNVARMYNYMVNGKDNIATDRAAVEALERVGIELRWMAGESRAFVRRAVRAVARRGVSQFLDLGCGLPTSPNVGPDGAGGAALSPRRLR